MTSALYLDTNFISELSKADIGFEDTPNYNLLSELLSIIRKGVHSTLIKCVTSQLSLSEIQSLASSPDLLKHANSLIHELCSGYYIKPWEDILVHQTAVEFVKYLEIHRDISINWTAFTHKNPDTIPTTSVQNAKNTFRSGIGEILSGRSSEDSFIRVYEIERKAIINETFRRPVLECLGIPTYGQKFDRRGKSSFLSQLLKAARISIDDFDLVKLLAFLESPSIDAIDYIHIFCSINASIRVYEKSRHYQRSDLFDLPILASAIPYCNIISTDKNMKSHVCNRLHFDSKYDVNFFSLSAPDLQALTKKIQNLLL
jgi:hypothetical protein